MMSLARQFARASCGTSVTSELCKLQPLVAVRAYAPQPNPESRSGSKMSPEEPEVLRHLKEKHLKGESEVAIPGAEGWSQALASASEAVVKAEKAPDVSVEELQRHSVEVIQQVHEGQPSPQGKVGMDVSQQPSLKENIERTHRD